MGTKRLLRGSFRTTYLLHPTSVFERSLVARTDRDRARNMTKVRSSKANVKSSKVESTRTDGHNHMPWAAATLVTGGVIRGNI